MTLALVACAIAALGLILLAAAGPAYRIGVLSLPNAFVLMQWAAYVGIAASVTALLSGWLAFRRGARVAIVLGAAALLGGLVAFGIPLQWQRAARDPVAKAETLYRFFDRMFTSSDNSASWLASPLVTPGDGRPRGARSRELPPDHRRQVTPDPAR